jgi:hypothetical protein
MNKKIGRILSAEEYFGSRTALGAMVRETVNPWLQMIPGMFLYEAYKRSRNRRLYARDYAFPRKIAMEIITAMDQGQDKQEAVGEARLKVRDWLMGAGLYSEAVEDANMEMIELIITHFKKLLSVEGNSYEDMLIEAYRTKASYDSYNKDLAGAERKVERAIVEKYDNDDELRKRLLAGQAIKEEMREKDADAIF